MSDQSNLDKAEQAPPQGTIQEGQHSLLGGQQQITPTESDITKMLTRIEELEGKVTTLNTKSKTNLTETETLRNTTNRLQELMIIGVAVLLIMLGAIVISYISLSLSSSNSLIDKIDALQLQLARHRWH